MNKVEKNIIDFINENWSTRERKNKTFSCRDYAEVTENAVRVFLWGHLIFSIDKKTKKAFFCFQGYATKTTKYRINAFLYAFSEGGIYQKNFSLFYTCKNYTAEIDSTKFYCVENGEIKEN
jgi:hypothetical protein